MFAAQKADQEATKDILMLRGYTTAATALTLVSSRLRHGYNQGGWRVSC